MNKISAVSLLAFLAFLPIDLAAEKQGARLEIRMLDGRTIVGELIAVRADKLILKDSTTLGDATVGISDVGTIMDISRTKPMSKQRSAPGVVGGAVAGFFVGMMLGSGLEADRDQSQWGFGPPPGVFAGALVGAAVGGILASSAGKTGKGRVLYTAGKTPAQEALKELRSMVAIQEAN